MTLFVGQAANLNTQRASQVFGFAAVVIAAAALVGWWASLPLLSSWGSAAMTPMSAVNHAALGVALMQPGKDSRFAFVISLVVIATAALDFGINRGLLPEAIVPVFEETWFRSQSGMPSATALIATALALSRFERHYFVAIVLSGLVSIITVFAVLGYLTGFDLLRGTVRSPGLPTAVSLLCVAVGSILRIGTIPEPYKSRPLWRLLVLLACAVIAPLLLLAVYTGFRITDAQLDQAHKDLMNEARTLSREVDREVASEIEKLQALAVSPSLRQGNFAEFQRQAEASLAVRQVSNLMLVDRSMQQVVNTWEPFGTPLEKAAIAEPVKRAFATGKPQIASLFSGTQTQKLVLGIVAPVQIAGENRYALIRPVDQRTLISLVAARELRPGLHVAISAAQRIIVRSEHDDAFSGKALLAVQWHCPGPGGIFEFADAGQRPSLGAYVCSDLTAWQTTVWERKELLDAPVRSMWWTIASIAALAFTLVVALALWLSRIVAHSVDQAARAAIALGKGEPLVLDGTPVAEVNILLAELQETAAKRRTAEQELQTSKDRLQIAFDATQLGWWQYDPRHATALVDARFKEIFGVTNDEVTIEDVVKSVHPDDRERFWADREAALDPTNLKPYLRHEYRIRRPDGALRWVEGSGLAYFEGSGRERRVVSFGGTVQDITERREREEKEHLLMREINHRAKNMLSVVDSIAHRTAAGSPEDFVERFSERIQALSANQDLLVRNEWQGVDVDDLVRAQLAHFADLIGSRIAMQGPKLRLNPASTQAIGLALHELATNAGKYGALSADKGRVDIDWEIGDDTFTMSWTERGGPPVSVPKQRGFGTIVIKSMAESGVRGTVDFDYAPSGVTWRLTCPAANALEPEWKMVSSSRADPASIPQRSSGL